MKERTTVISAKSVRWEYCRVMVMGEAGMMESGRLGREGWECLAVDNGWAYFKRPIT